MATPPFAIQERLYREHHGWLFRWLRRRMRCPERAADIAQDTFCRVLTGGPSTRPREPRAYLTRIATRLLIDHSRRERIERAYREAAALLAAEHAVAPSAERVSEVLDTLAAIARMLEGLPDRPRRAFLMSRLDGCRHDEIGAELGVSVSMVKKYIARALVHCYYADAPRDARGVAG